MYRSRKRCESTACSIYRARSASGQAHSTWRQAGSSEEARQTMDNIKTTLEAHGYSMSDVIKCTVMLADIKQWSDFNVICKTYFRDHFPARSAMGVAGLAIGAQVEVECVAYESR